MGQIVSSAAKPKRCNLNQLSQLGTPAAGQHILVSSDNSMNAAGQGNFDCYIVGDGTTAATALPLNKIVWADEELPNYIRREQLFSDSELVASSIEFNENGYYNYKNEYPTLTTASGFKCAKIDNVKAGDLFSYDDGRIRYSNLAAVVFLDENGRNIGYIYPAVGSDTMTVNIGRFSLPAGAASVIFNAYTGGGVQPVAKQYSLPTLLNEARVNEMIAEVVNPDNDLVQEELTLTKGIFYNYKTGVEGSNANFSGLELTDFSPNDKVRFIGRVAYSAIAAISFFNAAGENISYLYGDNTATPVAVDTGIVDIPAGCTKIIFGAYSASVTPSAFIYKQPDVINSVSIEKYIPKPTISYCNPFHYVFGVTSFDDVENSGFDAAFSSSTANAFLIHKKYFRAYRRRHEWRVGLSANSVIYCGTTNSPTAVAIASRMSRVKVDIPNLTMSVYNSNGNVYGTAAISSFSAGDYVVRMVQFDYTQTVELVNYASGEVVASYEFTAGVSDSPTGKLLGYPYVQLLSGSVSVKQYDTFLMYQPIIVFVGDSITECGYRQDTYAAKVIKAMNENGCIIAQGGANLDALSYSKTSEIPFMKPKYLSLLAGTNGSISAAQITSWNDFCETNGIKFILNCVPVSKTPSTYPWADKNSTILAAGILGARFDIATALNGDPDDGADDSLFGDDVHPNAEGQEKMYERFLMDVQII